MGSEGFPVGAGFDARPNGLMETAGEKWIVQKFGGTSVGKYPLNIVDNVVRRVLSLICAVYLPC
jgi:hypothetical protein